MEARKVIRVEEEEEDIIVQFNGLMTGEQDFRSRVASCKFFVSPASCVLLFPRLATTV